MEVDGGSVDVGGDDVSDANGHGSGVVGGSDTSASSGTNVDGGCGGAMLVVVVVSVSRSEIVVSVIVVGATRFTFFGLFFCGLIFGTTCSNNDSAEGDGA